MKPGMGKGDVGLADVLGDRLIDKDSNLVQAMGDIDEAASAIGLARSFVTSEARKQLLRDCQTALLKCASEIAAAGTGRRTNYDFLRATEALEDEINSVSRDFYRPTSAVASGATTGEAALDLARAVTRRAERAAVALQHSGADFNPGVAQYLNRLSDLLFDLSCAEAQGK